MPKVVIAVAIALVGAGPVVASQAADVMVKAILSDWRKSKKFVEQRAELIVCRIVSTQPHEQRPQIGRRGSFPAGLEGNAGNCCPTNKPDENENTA